MEVRWKSDSSELSVDEVDTPAGIFATRRAAHSGCFDDEKEPALRSLPKSYIARPVFVGVTDHAGRAIGPPIMTTPKTFHVKSFGCQMNVYDGERMGELMAAQGLTATADANDADLVVLNTCHIRERATEKVYSDIGRLRKHGRDPMIAVAGCVAQAEGAEIVRRAKVDVVVGPQAYHNLPELVAQAAAASRARHRHAGDQQVRRAALAPAKSAPPLPHRAGRLRQILHLLRGALYPRRRSQPAVRRDRRRGAGALVDAGAREITCSARTSTPGTMPARAAACTA
jgi:hypothetical protein